MVGALASQDSKQMDALTEIDPKDLVMLLKAEPSDLFARIVQLNRTPRYHNRLDAVQLPGLIARLMANRSRLKADNYQGKCQ